MRRFLLLFLFLCVALWAAGPYVDFVQVTDTHVNDFGSLTPKQAASMAAKKNANTCLETALKHFGAAPAPGFILITGDLIDAFENGRQAPTPVNLLQALLKQSTVPVFPILGNHDLRHYEGDTAKRVVMTDEARKAWMKALPQFRGGTYYSFRKQVGHTGYLFLLLDDADLTKDNPKFTAAEFAWMKKQIGAHPTDTIIIAMHLPFPMAPIADELKALLAQTPNVALIIAGHRHIDALEQVDAGSHHITQILTAALYRSADNFRRFRLKEDGIEVSETGKPDVIVKTIPVAALATSSR